VERDKLINNAELKQEKISDKEKLNSEKLYWMHVHAELNFLKDAKINQIPKNASEDITDVQEDA